VHQSLAGLLLLEAASPCLHEGNAECKMVSRANLAVEQWQGHVLDAASSCLHHHAGIREMKPAAGTAHMQSKVHCLLLLVPAALDAEYCRVLKHRS
jgi:hypothetical protein